MEEKNISVEGSVAEQKQTPADEVAYWCREIKAARSREKKWRKAARECVTLYEGDRPKEYQYNILYANTETMSPALYNEVPRPVVTRRYKDDDPIGKLASTVTQRTLEFLADSSLEEYSSYDDLMKFAVLSALVPGRGVIRWKYDAKIAKGEGDQQTIQSEYVCGEEWPWDRFTHGFSIVWRTVPWIAFDHYMTREDLIANFGEEIGTAIPLTLRAADVEDTALENEGRELASESDESNMTLAKVHEIWDKAKREVVFVAPGYEKAPVKRASDPLGLTGFFPVAKPLMFFAKLKTLVPTTLYQQYKEQARELNHITLRINKLIGAMQVRGLYDSRFDAIKRVLNEAEETDLVPVDDMASLPDFKTFDQLIWTMPIDKLIGVLQQLYLQREQIKTVIYEIMGIADILRGSSKASETFGAQDLKAKWGSLRMKRMQKLVMGYCRDCFRIMGEIATLKLGPETLRAMTGIPLPTAEEKAQAQAVLASQPLAMPGQPPNPQVAQLQAVASGPSWDDVLALLRNDLTRAYRIDVETNSTIDPEATEDQRNITELMTAISQFINGIGPLVQDGTMPFDVVKSMLMFVTRRFRMGDEIEGMLKSLQGPPPKQAEGPDPAEMARVELEKAEFQANQQLEQAKFQAERQEAAQRMALEAQKAKDDAALARWKAEQDVALARYKSDVDAKLELDKMALSAKTDLDKTKITTASSERQAKLNAEVQTRQQEAEDVREQAGQAKDLIKTIQTVVQQAEKSESDNTLSVMVQGLTQILQAVTAPKTITLKNGPDGVPTSATVKTGA